MHLEGVTQEGAAVKRRNEPKEREKTWHLAVLCAPLGGRDPSCVQARLRRFRATEPPPGKEGTWWHRWNERESGRHWVTVSALSNK